MVGVDECRRRGEMREGGGREEEFFFFFSDPAMMI